MLLSRNPTADEHSLRHFLEGVHLLGITSGTCEMFGRLRGKLRSEGRMIPDFDLMIAATALEHDLTLLSNNRRHFERIQGLRIEST